jgi:hypothetical protein
MKLDNSNRRYSDIIAWILVVALLSIFMGIFIGCWGNCINEKKGAELAFPFDYEDQILSFDTGNFHDELAAQTSPIMGVDTQTGSLDYIEASFYNYTDDLIVDMTVFGGGQFPLCIPAWDDLLGVGYYFNITVNVTGGYSPVDVGWCDYIQLKQYKCGPGSELLHTYKIYYDASSAWDLIEVGVCWDIWRLHIVVDQDICFESNHKWDCTGTLNKWVTAKLKSSWEGCPLTSQQFCCCKKWYCLDTEKGEMNLLNLGIFDPAFKFDLCYDENDDILGYIYLHVSGGYEYLNIDKLTIWQEKPDGTYISGLYELSDITWDEYDEPIGVNTYIDSLMDGCCETVFVGTVNLGSDIILLDETGAQVGTTTVMKFESNHPPPCCWPPRDNLDKFVKVKLESDWTGCGQVSQTFTYMLVHKNNISRVPNSRFHRQLNVIIFRHTFMIAV